MLKLVLEANRIGFIATQIAHGRRSLFAGAALNNKDRRLDFANIL
jgi:hypothetical protein